MPPKAAVAQSSAVDAKFKADQDEVMARAGEFLAAHRPPLSVDEYSALIPRYTAGPHWTAQEEADLQAEGRYAIILQQGPDIWEKNKGARFLWRLFPMVYRCLPTDLFSWIYQIDVDTSRNVNVETERHGRQRNLVWTQHFCHALVSFTMHGFWAYKREWDFPVMAQLMQLAVICRTNDCRPWHLVNHTEDTFFNELANELQVQPVGERTIKDVVDAVEARMKTRNLRPSQFRLLCQDIVGAFFKPNVRPLLDGTPGPYRVTTEDLNTLAGILGRSGHSAGGIRVPIGWSAETWKTIMEKSWPHDNRQEPQPNRANGMLLARAVMFGLVKRERDEKIAERAAQAQAQAQAQQQPQPQPPASSDPFDNDSSMRSPLGKGKEAALSAEDEDTMMADGGGGAYEDYGPNNFGSDAGELPEPEISPQAGANKKFVDDLLTQIEGLKAFDRKQAGSRGRDDLPRGWEEE